ncbi:cytochrome c oxidase assembly factor 4 homolog, mitochondrial-like [Pecten maximus]|uniref:cytochrome c oxidase assembly factor 4 homolog, mitochondrial-like n=1 Tax=Pecten maximus TaxID=6579 RepID=UPI0014580163|nr:cytochrome c oxidase assembly factor 4 homolog, mitochondrial-like [Pecten maximus]
MATHGATMPGHDRSKRPTKSEEDDDDDPVEKLLKKAGCLDQHYAVQECMFDNKDWTKCQNQVKEFRECVERSQKKKK